MYSYPKSDLLHEASDTKSEPSAICHLPPVVCRVVTRDSWPIYNRARFQGVIVLKVSHFEVLTLTRSEAYLSEK